MFNNINQLLHDSVKFLSTLHMYRSYHSPLGPDVTTAHPRLSSIIAHLHGITDETSIYDKWLIYV